MSIFKSISHLSFSVSECKCDVVTWLHCDLNSLVEETCTKLLQFILETDHPSWAKNGRSCHNCVCIKMDKQTDHLSWQIIHNGLSDMTDYCESSSGWMIRLLGRIYTQRDYQTTCYSLLKFDPDAWSVPSINLTNLNHISSGLKNMATTNIL